MKKTSSKLSIFELVFFTASNIFWKKLKCQNQNGKCIFFSNLKKITMTKSSTNFLSPEPNGQGYNQTCCWFDIFCQIAVEVQNLLVAADMGVAKTCIFFWFNEKYSNQQKVC